MKKHLDDIGYAASAIAMLLLGFAALAGDAGPDPAVPRFELPPVTIVAARPPAGPADRAAAPPRADPAALPRADHPPRARTAAATSAGTGAGSCG